MRNNSFPEVVLCPVLVPGGYGRTISIEIRKKKKGRGGQTRFEKALAP